MYVSCDSATLARDVKFLRGNGYELERVRAVDQFPHTVHVETVVPVSYTHLDVYKRQVLKQSVNRIISPDAVQMITVSSHTPAALDIPCFTGWLVSAAAAVGDEMCIRDRFRTDLEQTSILRQHRTAILKS